MVLTVFWVAVIISVYFLPRLEKYKTLKTEQKQIADIYYKLVQNRISYISYTKLDANDIGFYTEKIELLDTLMRTNQETSELSSNLYKSDTNWTPAQNTRELISEQNKVLVQINSIHTTFQDVYEYDPYKDLETSDIFLDKESLIEKLARASNAISKLKLESEDSQISSKINQIVDHIVLTQMLLSTQSPEAKDALDEFAVLMYELKQLAFNKELSVLREDQNVKSLTDLTNNLIEFKNRMINIKSDLNTLIL